MSDLWPIAVLVCPKHGVVEPDECDMQRDLTLKHSAHYILESACDQSVDRVLVVPAPGPEDRTK